MRFGYLVSLIRCLLLKYIKKKTTYSKQISTLKLIYSTQKIKKRSKSYIKKVKFSRQDITGCVLDDCLTSTINGCTVICIFKWLLSVSRQRGKRSDGAVKSKGLAERWAWKIRVIRALSRSSARKFTVVRVNPARRGAHFLRNVLVQQQLTQMNNVIFTFFVFLLVNAFVWFLRYEVRKWSCTSHLHMNSGLEAVQKCPKKRVRVR